MKKIVFVGERQQGFFAEEVAAVRGYQYVNVPRKANIEKQVNDVLFAADGAAEYIIFDVDQYISSAEEIAETVQRICSAVGADPIIFAPAFVPESEMARAFVNRDIKAFILSGSATDLKDQLEKNMNGFFDKNSRREIERVVEIQQEERAHKLTFKTIGVAGVCSRIGTTTQGLQITRYLNAKGYKACFIEANDTRYNDRKNGIISELSYVEKIEAWFEVDELDEEQGLVRAFDIDMYYDQSKIPEILKKGYDYYVYDYGYWRDRGFNKTAFVREDIQVFVMGSSVTELDYTKEAAENQAYQTARYIFSLTAPSEQEDLKGLMDSIRPGSAGQTYFAPFCPDPFTLAGEAMEVYEQMIPVEDITLEPEKKRRRIFGKKGGHHGKIR